MIFGGEKDKYRHLSIDRTLKMYIGGAQKRPDAPYARPVVSPSGNVVGQVGEGNRKDIRDAVEAAYSAAPGLMVYDVIDSTFEFLFLQLGQTSCSQSSSNCLLYCGES